LGRADDRYGYGVAPIARNHPQELVAKQDSEYGVVVGNAAERGTPDAGHHGFPQQVFEHGGNDNRELRFQQVDFDSEQGRLLYVSAHYV